MEDSFRKYTVKLSQAELLTLTKIIENLLNPGELEFVLKTLTDMEKLDIRSATEIFIEETYNINPLAD